LQPTSGTRRGTNYSANLSHIGWICRHLLICRRSALYTKLDGVLGSSSTSNAVKGSAPEQHAYTSVSDVRHVMPMMDLMHLRETFAFPVERRHISWMRESTRNQASASVSTGCFWQRRGTTICAT